MKLWIDDHFYIDITNESFGYTCRIMEIQHGNYGSNAYITENNEDLKDIKYRFCNDYIFSKLIKECYTLEDIFEYHKHCIVELLGGG